MAKRITAIVSQGQSQNPAKRQLEEDIVQLIGDVRELLLPPLEEVSRINLVAEDLLEERQDRPRVRARLEEAELDQVLDERRGVAVHDVEDRAGDRVTVDPSSDIRAEAEIKDAKLIPRRHLRSQSRRALQQDPPNRKLESCHITPLKFFLLFFNKKA